MYCPNSSRQSGGMDRGFFIKAETTICQKSDLRIPSLMETFRIIWLIHPDAQGMNYKAIRNCFFSGNDFIFEDKKSS